MRLLVCTAAIIGGLVAAVVLVPRAFHELNQLHQLNTQALSPVRPIGARARRPPRGGRPRSGLASGGATQIAGSAASKHGRGGGSLSPLEAVALSLCGSVALIIGIAGLLALRRTRRRRTRTYELYELHLSTHDQAKGQDLEDMVEAIANSVRAWPTDRARNGQPYVALELICSAGNTSGSGREMEWSINMRCEPRAVTALDGAISAAYPDVRLGRIHGEQPRPCHGALREPRCLMRFCKQRSFIYSLIADGEEQASSPIEQIARAQIAQDAPSVVRFQLTPTPVSFEGLVRRLYRRHEHSLARARGAGDREGGLWSTFDRAEMRAAERTQNRGLFWLEAVVAADSSEVCKTVAAAVQSRRGENRLRRRWMVVRQGLYRRRFPRALAPLFPSFRCLVSAAEVAHMLELPSARMKGVPVRRVTIPRIPAPPEVVRGSRPRPIGLFVAERGRPAAIGSSVNTNGAAASKARTP